MLRRNLTVVFKPSKNNALQLPASYFDAVQKYQERGCIRLTYLQNKRDHYMAWAPQAGNLRDTEIGINSNVANAIGMKEGCIVTCTILEDAPTLQSITIIPSTKKDWDMLEASSYRIQSTMLDQTRVVTADQRLVIWINAAMTLLVDVRRLSPDIGYGRLCADTQLIVKPINSLSTSQSCGNFLNGTSAARPRDLPQLMSTAELSERINAAQQRTEQQPHNGTTAGGGASNGHPSTAVTRNGRQLEPSPSTHQMLQQQHQLYQHQHQQSTAAVEAELQSLAEPEEWFRLVADKWPADVQLYDVYTTKHNLPADMDTSQIFELYGFTEDCNQVQCYVNVNLLPSTEVFPRNAFRTLRVSEPLLRTLGVTELVQMRLTQCERQVTTSLERIELLPAHGQGPSGLRDLEVEFKQWVVRRSRPVLLNQGEVFRLSGECYVTVRLVPARLKYACVDGTALRMCRVTCTAEVEEIIALEPEVRPRGLRTSASLVSRMGFEGRSEFVRLEKFQAVIDRVTEYLVKVMALDTERSDADRFNVLLSGKSKSGKTVICKRILEALAAKPYWCYTGLLDCTQYKGRKPESIERDLRDIFEHAMMRMPAVLVLDNLDMLTPTVGEHTQDAEYTNRVADVIRKLIDHYTTHRKMCIIATCANTRAINKRVQKARGSYTFHHLSEQSPTLERADREQVLRTLTVTMRPKRVGYRRIAGNTEGYGIGDLVELAQRAIFFAHKRNTEQPSLCMDDMVQSLRVTSEYCLHGVQNGGDTGDANGSDDEDDDADDEDCDNGDARGRRARRGSVSSGTDSDSDQSHDTKARRPHPRQLRDPRQLLPGLGDVTKVLEEVLIWPAKYQHIFGNSPLRNQAGVLLFGAPGTGKTYAVAKLARLWRLRLISVKGPELLAKYIGQSEENVRNVFDRARKVKPCVLFFDEFDSLAPKRGHDSTGVTDRVVNQMLTELDGVQGLDGVIVIAATSRPDLLDGALLRSGRIDRMVEIPLPDRQARLEILAVQSRSLQLAPSVELGALADGTERFTGADLHSLLTTASTMALKKCMSLTGTPPDSVIVDQQHLIDAMHDTRPSLPPAEMERFNKIYKRFSSVQTQTTQDFSKQRTTLA